VIGLTATANEVSGDGRSLEQNVPVVNAASNEQLAGMPVQSQQDEMQTKQADSTKQTTLLPQLAKEYVTPDMVTVVVPVLNEREGIGKVLDDLRSEGFDNVLVVDGYSTDGTLEIAKSKGVNVLQQHGKGKAGALKTSIDVTATPYMVVMDGDGTYKAGDVSRLLAHAAYYDEVIGARTAGRKNIPLVHRFGNRLISKTFKLLFGQPVTDVLSGMYLVGTEKIREVEMTSDSFDIEAEIACSIASNGRVTEVPISYGERIGMKKLRSRDGGRILSTMLWMAYYYNPLLLFGGLISLSAIPAVGLLSLTLYDSVRFNVWHSGYAVVGTVLLLVATQGAALSMSSLLTKRSENRILAELRKTRQRV
jgi:dolichol-phosphate hexosyltransferase